MPIFLLWIFVINSQIISSQMKKKNIQRCWFLAYGTLIFAKFLSRSILAHKLKVSWSIFDVPTLLYSKKCILLFKLSSRQILQSLGWSTYRNFWWSKTRYLRIWSIYDVKSTKAGKYTLISVEYEYRQTESCRIR